MEEVKVTTLPISEAKGKVLETLAKNAGTTSANYLSGADGRYVIVDVNTKHPTRDALTQLPMVYDTEDAAKDDCIKDDKVITEYQYFTEDWV